jgi:Inhibitor of Apoptosis domain
MDSELMDVTDSVSQRVYKFYEDRLSTFDTWSSQIVPDKYQLAKAGFYYSGYSDKVVCFFCHIELSKWEKTDNPWDEHTKHSPSCEYLKIVGVSNSVDLIDRSSSTGFGPKTNTFAFGPKTNTFAFGPKTNTFAFGKNQNPISFNNSLFNSFST